MAMVSLYSGAANTGSAMLNVVAAASTLARSVFFNDRGFSVNIK
jgi:hypothetical protein